MTKPIVVYYYWWLKLILWSPSDAAYTI